jgi:hypothetical protein
VRRLLGITMPVLLGLTILVGIAESGPDHEGPPVAHIFLASLFLLTLFSHVWLNRKAFVSYFKPKAKR